MKLKKLLSELRVETGRVYSNPYVTAFKPMEEDVEISKDEMEKLHSDGEVEVDDEKLTYDQSVDEVQIPGNIEVRLQKALDVLSVKKLTYPQKLQVLGKVLDSMDIDKAELARVTQKLKTNLESVNESNDVYHKSYTHAIEAAEVYAKKKGYEIEDDEMFTKVGMNSKRPSVGKTTRVSLELLKNGKPQKKMLHIQVYGMKNGYELNAYIN